MHVPNKVQKKEPDACAFRIKHFAAATALTLALLPEVASSTLAQTLTAPPININGSRVTIGALERANSVFVPVRGFFGKLGAQVTNSGSSLVATRRGKELARMTIGSRSATVNGSSYMLAVAPFVSGGVAMLPLRVISEAAGASVAYVAAPRTVDVTRSAAGAGMAEAAAAGTAAATAARAVAPAAAPAATDVAGAAPVSDTQTHQSGIPWWVWALLALLVLGLILWALTRRKKEPIITTTSSPRGSEPAIRTTGNVVASEPIIRTRK